MDFRKKKEPLPWKKISVAVLSSVIVIGCIWYFFVPSRPKRFEVPGEQPIREAQEVSEETGISFLMKPRKINPDWDFKKSRLFLRLNTEGHSATVTGLLFNPGHKKLLSASSDKTIKVWDISDLKNPCLYSTIRDRISPGLGRIASIKHSADWRYLAVTREEAIWIYDLTDWGIIKILGNEKKITHSVCSPDIDIVAYRTSDNTLVIFHSHHSYPSMGRMIHAWKRKILSGITSPITSVSISNHRLAFSTADGFLRVIDTKNHLKLIKKSRLNSEKIKVVRFSASGKYLLVGMNDGSMIHLDHNGGFIKDFAQVDSSFKTICFSPDDHYVMVVNDLYYPESTFNLFTFPEGHPEIEISHPLKLSSISSGLQEDEVIWGLADVEDNSVSIMNNQGKIISRIGSEGNDIYSLHFTGDRRLAFSIAGKTGSRDGHVNLKREYELDMNTLELLPSGDVYRDFDSKAVSSDYHLENRSSVSFDLTIHGPQGIINIIKGKKTSAKIVQGQLTGGIYTCHTLVKDRFVIAGGKNGVIDAYDIEGSLIARLVGHEGDISSMTPSRDGKWLASSSTDRTLRLWNLEMLRERRFPMKWNPEILFERLKRSGYREADITDLKDKLGRCFLADPILHAALVKYLFLPYTRGPRIFPFLSIYTLENDWLMWVPEGYFSSNSLGTMRLVGHHLNILRRILPIHQVFDKFFRPDLIKLKLNDHVRFNKVIKRGQNEFLNQMLIFSPPPEIDIISPESGIESDESLIKVRVKVRDIGGGIGDVRLYHNGKLAFSMNVFRVEKNPKPRSNAVFKGKVESSGDQKFHRRVEDFEKTFELELVPGKNEISIQALNYQNTLKTGLKSLIIHCPHAIRSNKLFILGAGIQNFRDRRINLTFPHNDVKDISTLIKAHNQENYEDIIVKTLFDPGKQKILDAFSELNNTMSPGDTFVFCISTHGALKDDVYHLITADFVGALTEESSICGHDLMRLSKDLPALKQIFILDTCHAGAVGWEYNDLYESRLMGISLGSGLNILYASTPYAFALEGYQLHGFLSYAVIEALKGKADENRDRKVSLSELGRFVKETVRSISSGFQNPVLSIVSKNIIISEL